MRDNTEIPFTTVADLTRDEKREIWMRRTGHTVSSLSSIVGVVPNVLSRYLRQEEMPALHHEKLIAYGMPPELLPAPVNKPKGRTPRTARLSIQ